MTTPKPNSIPMQTVVVPAIANNGTATLVVPAFSEPILIVNSDTTNEILLGDSNAIRLGDVNVVPLPANASVVIGGRSTDTFAIAVNAPVTVFLISGGLQYNTANITEAINASAQIIANALSNTGVPAIDHPTLVQANIGPVVPANGVFNSGRLDVSKYQSLVGTILGNENTAPIGNNPWFRIDAQWSLQSDNFDPLVTESWVAALTPEVIAATFTSYRNDWKTPCYGDTLTLNITNYDNQAFTLAYGLFGSFRARSRSEIRSRYPDDFGFENQGFGSDDMVTIYNVAALGAGAGTLSAEQVMNLWEGPCSLSFYAGNGAAANTLALHIRPQPFSILNTEYVFYNTGAWTYVTGIILPRRVCTIRFENRSSNAFANIGAMVSGQVQPN